MLKQDILEQENAIEEYFCKPFEKLKPHAMSDELSHIFITCLSLSKQKVPISKEMNDIPLVQIIKKRIQYCFDYTIDDSVLVFFIATLTETPGAAVMYLTYLQYWCKKNNVKKIDFETFSMIIFPMGFPTDNALSKLWDATKVETVDRTLNLIDCANSLKSLRFEKETN